MPGYSRCMARRPVENFVRPLDDVAVARRPSRPVPVIALVLFSLGIAGGYLLGLTGDDTAATAPTTTSTSVPPVGAGAASLTVADFEWTEQMPPEHGPGLWAVHKAIEHDGQVYLLIVDDIGNRISRALWRSHDGASWERVTLGLGDDAVATDLDVYQGQLMISGWLGERPAVWRSADLIDAAAVQWARVSLPSEPFPFSELQRVFSRVSTQVNDEDELVVVATMQYAIDPDLLAGRSDYVERPELVVTDSAIWTKIIDGTGTIHMGTTAIPGNIAVKPTSGKLGTDVIELQAWSSWHSTDGRSFGALEEPDFDLAPIVNGFGDGFVASVPVPGNRFELLFSEDGSTWVPPTNRPPAACGAA